MWGPAVGSKNRNTAAFAEDKEVVASGQICVKMLRGIRWQSYF